LFQAIWDQGFEINTRAATMTNGKAEVLLGVSSWAICSVGMMVFNKLAVTIFPYMCTLLAMQMAFTVLCLLLFAFKSVQIGSFHDAVRWSRVAPFYLGMLATSLLALKAAPMSLVITFRVFAPVCALLIEQFFPDPLRVNKWMILSIGGMCAGAFLYTCEMESSGWVGARWVLLNNVLAVIERLLARLMLSKDQHPVDISMTGTTLLNNLFCVFPMLALAYWKGELSTVPDAMRNLPPQGWILILASCVVGVGIGYCGVWAQSLISATSMLVLVNVNKFAIIFIEGVCLGTKQLSMLQTLGALTALTAGAFYGKAKDMKEIGGKMQPPLPLSAPQAIGNNDTSLHPKSTNN